MPGDTQQWVLPGTEERKAPFCSCLSSDTRGQEWEGVPTLLTCLVGLMDELKHPSGIHCRGYVGLFPQTVSPPPACRAPNCPLRKPASASISPLLLPVAVNGCRECPFSVFYQLSFRAKPMQNFKSGVLFDPWTPFSGQ